MIEVALSDEDRWLLVAALESYEAFCDEHSSGRGDELVDAMLAHAQRAAGIKAALEASNRVVLSARQLRAAALALWHLQLRFAQLNGRLGFADAFADLDADGIEHLRDRLRRMRVQLPWDLDDDDSLDEV